MEVPHAEVLSTRDYSLKDHLLMNVTHSSISKLMVTVRSQQGSELLLINPSISRDLINLFILTFLSGG